MPPRPLGRGGIFMCSAHWHHHGDAVYLPDCGADSIHRFDVLRIDHRRVSEGVDAAVVDWNASTRFTDGFEFGFGAELGISTQKLHARGPMGLTEITSYKYLVIGTGQVRP